MNINSESKSKSVVVGMAGVGIIGGGILAGGLVGGLGLAVGTCLVTYSICQCGNGQRKTDNNQQDPKKSINDRTTEEAESDLPKKPSNQSGVPQILEEKPKKVFVINPEFEVSEEEQESEIVRNTKFIMSFNSLADADRSKLVQAFKQLENIVLSAKDSVTMDALIVDWTNALNAFSNPDQVSRFYSDQRLAQEFEIGNYFLGLLPSLLSQYAKLNVNEKNSSLLNDLTCSLIALERWQGIDLLQIVKCLSERLDCTPCLPVYLEMIATFFCKILAKPSQHNGETCALLKRIIETNCLPTSLLAEAQQCVISHKEHCAQRESAALAAAATKTKGFPQLMHLKRK